MAVINLGISGAPRQHQGDPTGIDQAAWALHDLLCRSDLRRLARSGQALAGVALQVAAGAADTVTPPEACAALAAEFDAPFTRVPGAGHALPLEQPGAVSALLLSACPLP